MASRLTEGLSGGGGDNLRPGETRTILAKDKQGNVLKTIVVHRTERDYVHDLCDAYNSARDSDAVERGVEWFVAPNGELKIGISDDWTRKNLKQIEQRKRNESALGRRRQMDVVP